MGAKGGEMKDFMKDGYTRANLPRGVTNQKREVEIATRAINVSTRPARAILLTTVGAWDKGTGHTRVHTLASIPKGAIEMIGRGLFGDQLSTNDTDLCLLLIENRTAPEADYDSIKERLARTCPKVQLHIPPWASPGSTPMGSLPRTTTRNPAHRWPQLTWYRDEPRMEKGQLVELTCAQAILTAMGIGPKTLRTELTRAGIHPTTLSPEVLTKIKARVRLTSFQAYTRQKTWRRELTRGYRANTQDASW